MSPRIVRALVALALVASAFLVINSGYVRANEGKCPCRTEGNTPGEKVDQGGSTVCVEC